MVFEIGSTDKILIISAQPDDLAVACGGFICKYREQIDILCVNRDFAQSKISPQVRFGLFQAIADTATVNKAYIESPAGVNDDYENYQTNFNMNDYDIILIPHSNEIEPEHKFISDKLLKTMLENQGFKENLQILRYEVWTPLKEANYYEDISDFIDAKKSLLLSYKDADGVFFAERVLSMNKFRTFTSYFSGSASHVEAYLLDDLSAFMDKPDIVNEVTDKDFKNEEIEAFLKESDAQSKINTLAKRYQGKKIVLFGAGEFLRCIFKNYDLSGLNIIAAADRRFEQGRTHQFYGLNCITPNDIKTIGADVVLISTYDFIKFYDILTNTILKDFDIEIAPIIQTDLSSIVKDNAEEKICVRPFHALSIVPTGHCITCCPAYIKNFTIGNVFRDDFEHIWRGRRAKYLRKALMNNDYTMCDLNTCIYMELKNKNDLSQYFEQSGEIKMPDTIFMGWDYDCNVACITCRNKIIKNDENTLKDLQAIEQSVLDACRNAKFFYSSGNGDPFGSSYARGIIKKVAEINPDIRFLIHTNGVLCNEKTCFEMNILDKIHSITFSIHAACKETYDKIVRFGNFDRVIQNLEWVSSLKKSGQIEVVYMVFVVHKLNYKDMPDFVRLAEKFDAIASFRYYRQWANNTEYNYEDMAVFETNHPEHSEFVRVLKDKIFDSPNCFLDPSLQLIRNGDV